MPTPTVGIFQNTFEQYQAIPAINSSSLKWGRKSWAHCLAAIQGLMEKDTEAKRFGRKIHTAIFEPTLFKRIAIRPADMKDFRSKAAQEWRDANPNHVTPDQLQTIQAMKKSIYAHPEASKLLTQPGKGEVSIVAQDKETGLFLKCRVDYLGRTIVDGKSTVDADPIAHGFPRQCALYGYHIQEAFYRRVIQNLPEEMLHAITGGPVSSFIFLAFEKEPPYAVSTIELDAVSVNKGAEEVDRLLLGYKDCLEKKAWPGYSDKVEPVTIPTWALKEQPFQSAEGYELLEA